MTKHRVTLEIDGTRLFDVLHDFQQRGEDGWSKLGFAIGSTLMTGKQSFREACLLAVYGIETVENQAAAIAMDAAQNCANDAQ